VPISDSPRRGDPVTSTKLVFGALAAAILLTVAGCGHVERTPMGHPARSAAARPTDSDSPSADDTTIPDDSYPTLEPLPPTNVPTAPADTVAVACGGRPSPSQVIAAVRRDRNLLPPGVTPQVLTGPLCAGSWQYTIMSIPDHDPLQVVTRGSASSLTVVIAGTYVCTPEVTGAAPSGIVSAAHCQ
jgi:hypothetical protein